MEQVVEEYEVQRLLGEALLYYWPQITREMDRVPHTWDRWWTKDALLEGASCGVFQVWAAGTKEQHRIIFVTQVGVYPAGNILQGIMIFGRDLEGCAPISIAVMERFARQMGCASMELTGRVGWEKVLAPYGFKKRAVLLTRDIVDHTVN